MRSNYQHMPPPSIMLAISVSVWFPYFPTSCVSLPSRCSAMCRKRRCGAQDEKERERREKRDGITERATRKGKDGTWVRKRKSRGSASDRLLYSVLVRLPAGYLRRKLTARVLFATPLWLKSAQFLAFLCSRVIIYASFTQRLYGIIDFGGTKCIPCHAWPCHRSAKIA